MKPSHFNVVTLLSLVSLVAAAAPPLEAQSSTVFAMPGIPTRAKGVPKAPIVVMISMHDDAEVLWGTIRASENEASRVFREAGIEIDWRNCHASPDTSGEAREWKNQVETAFPEQLHVRIVKRSIGLSPEVMGISFLSTDGRSQADVFYDEIKGLQTNTNASLITLLGHVTAHEIGHLLLGPNAHTPRGIMRAAWGHDELESASQGRLLFSAQESQQMRERLASRVGAACVGMERGAACTTPLN